MSALEKKDFQKIVTLALSQSQDVQKMGMIMNETVSSIDKSSCKSVDNLITDKITNIIRSQPKNNASVLRATVAPIRNESIVNSSSTNIANYVMTNNLGVKTKSHVTRFPNSQNLNDNDCNSLFSSELKPDSCVIYNSASSSSDTSPMQQPSQLSLLSRSKIFEIQSISSNDTHQGYTYQTMGTTDPVSLFQFSNQVGPVMTKNDNGNVNLSKGINRSQMRCKQNAIRNNGIVCNVTPSKIEDHLTSTQTNNYPILVPQNVLISLPSGTISNQPCQNVITTCSMTSSDTIQAPVMVVTTPTISNSVYSTNLPRILPKPGNRIIAPKTLFAPQQYFTQSLSPHTQPQQSKHSSINRRTNVRVKGVKRCRTNKSKDNIMMAWEIAEQSLACNDQSPLEHPFLFHLENESDDFHSIEGSDFFEKRGSSLDKNEIVEEYDHSINLLSGLDEFLDDLSDEKQYSAVKIIDDFFGDVCYENIVLYRNVSVIRVAPLMRATATLPVVNNGSVQMVKLRREIDIAKEKSVVTDIRRVEQLLSSHLRSRSDIFPPLLKCLLPLDSLSNLSSVMITCPELLITEETVNNLGNSCYPLPSFYGSQSPILQSIPRYTVFGNVGDSNLSLHSFTSSDLTVPSWIKTPRSCYSWTQNGNNATWSKYLEVPAMKKRNCGPLLRKKSNYHNNVRYKKKRFKLRYNSDKYRRRMIIIRQNNDSKRRTSILAHTTTGRLKIKISLANCLDFDVTKLVPVTDKCDQLKSDKMNMISHRSLLYKHSEIRISENAKTGIDSGKTDPYITTVVNDTITNDISVLIESIYDQSQVPLITQTNSFISKPFRSLKVSTGKTRKKSAKKKFNTSSKRRKKRFCGVTNNATVTPKQSKKNESNINRIFCTRKEDRRSSVLYSKTQIKSSTKKRVHSPTKKKRTKIAKDNPPIIVKICSKKIDLSAQGSVPQVSDEGDHERVIATSDTIKLLIKRSGQCTYKSQISSVQPPSVDEYYRQESITPVDDNYHYSPSNNLMPPNHHRVRAQQAALQFSPSHSSSDSDVGCAHNEISSLLQRQEEREPLSHTSDAISATIFPSLPVPYLVGTEPSVFMDPHKVDLITVKNFRYKVSSTSQRDHTEDPEPNINLFSYPNNAVEMFVPGCFLENDKTTGSWNRSSPSMPVLAPQEPLVLTRNNCKSSQRSYSKSNFNSSDSQRSQQLLETQDCCQQSPLCMTTNTQLSTLSNQNNIVPADPQKSPSYHHSDYLYQTDYNSSFYHEDSSTQSMLELSTNSSKNHMQASSGDIDTRFNKECSSQLSDYSYFQNHNQQKLSIDKSVFPIPSSSYQTIIPESSNHSSAVKSTLKRSSNRTQTCEQSSLQSISSSSTTKKRKEAPADSNSLTEIYSSNNDLCNAAAQYSGFDYYGSGFSNIFSNMDQMKLYEQCAREYSLQLGSNMPSIYPNIQWSNAMAEYCKQAAALSPSIVAATSSNVTSPDSNPISLSTNTQNSDYSNSYAAYAMSHPYSMYSSFGVPK